MRKLTKRTTAIVAAAIIGVSAIGATAWAAGWFTSNATATVTTATSSPIVGTITFNAPLYPTATVAATANVTNPNPYAVKITGITLSNFAGASGCNEGNAGISFDNPELVVAANTNIPAAALVAHMNQWASDSCAGLAAGIQATATLTGSVVAV